MLQSIRPSTLMMPPFGQSMSLGGIQQKVEGYSDADAWSWPPPSHSQSQSYAPIFDPALYTNFGPQPPVPGSVQPRHHSLAASHVINTGTSTPPPARQQISGSMVKAQPAFKPTWHGFLDTTKDAMTIVEAALQGRLSHISRRPHDKERAEMLTSGTVLVYEENASGIKRWTDAVHWSPSRVMNNCLIYRQLVRALKPEEKKSALNPSCGGKRKRKELVGPSITKSGENVTNSEDEYDHPPFDGAVPGDATPTDAMGKVYANFAQSLSPDQQRRFCGSLIDSYEFKEGGLMKKTISVKYQGTTHHIISYYSLEDVVAGKLKRPCQDPKLAEIHPRPELLANWKVSLEDEESKDTPLVGYPHQHQPSHIHNQTVGAHGIPPAHPQLHVQLPEYWQNAPVSQYSSTHQSPQHYTPPPPGPSHYVPQQPSHHYPVRHPSPLQYSSHPSAARSYTQDPSPQHYSAPHGSAQQFPSPAAPAHQYPSSTPPTAHQYPSEQHISPVQHYGHPPAAAAAPPPPPPPPPPPYSATHQDQLPPPSQYTVPQAPVYDTPVPSKTQSPIPQGEPGRRASAPVALQPYAPYPAAPSQPQPHSYYVPDEKYATGSSYEY